MLLSNSDVLIVQKTNYEESNLTSFDEYIDARDRLLFIWPSSGRCSNFSGPRLINNKIRNKKNLKSVVGSLLVTLWKHDGGVFGLMWIDLYVFIFWFQFKILKTLNFFNLIGSSWFNFHFKSASCYIFW